MLPMYWWAHKAAIGYLKLHEHGRQNYVETGRLDTGVKGTPCPKILHLD